MDAFKRQKVIREGGWYDAYEAAEARRDAAECNRIAAAAGVPYTPPITFDERADGAFAFTRVGDALAEGLRPTDWLIRGYLEADAMALAFGDPGCGKSFLAIDMACSVATGTPWHGRKVTPGPVFYIAGEGQNGLNRRFAAWSQHRGIPLTGENLFTGRRPAMLCNAGAAAEVANAVTELCERHDTVPRLIVVDTLARNFGGNENDAEDMSAFVSNLDLYLRQSGDWSATVLVVHHSGHGEKHRGRGSSVLKAAVDAEFMVTKDESKVVRMEATKMKDAEDPPPLAFSMTRVELDGLFDDEGEPVTSVALTSVEHVPPAKNGKPGRGKNQIHALAVLRDLVAEGRARLSAGGQPMKGVRVTLDQWRERLADNGINRNRFYEVRDRLKEAGSIVIEFGGFVKPAEDEAPL